MGATPGSNKVRREEIRLRTKKCGFCKMHDGENRGRRVRPDRYKKKDRASIRKG